MNEVERYGSPIYREQPAPQLISRRLYNLVLTGFVGAVVRHHGGLLLHHGHP